MAAFAEDVAPESLPDIQEAATSADGDQLGVATQADNQMPEALPERVNEDSISDAANVLVDHMTDFLIGNAVTDTSIKGSFWSSLYSLSNENEQEPPPSSSRLDSEWGYVFQKQDTNKRKKMDAVSSSTGAYSSDVSEALSAISAALSLPSPERDEEYDLEMWLNALRCPLQHNRNEIQAESNFGENGKTNEANFVVPAVGMEFSSEGEVYKFYKTYAEKSGFCVRKGKVQRRSDGSIRKRFFYCSREGRKRDKETVYKRKETRTGCSARIVCKLEKYGKWNISEFIEDHNHHLECAKISKIHVVNAEGGVGIPTEAVSTESARHDEKVNVLDLEEVRCLMNYFSYLKEEDPSFFSEVQHDDDGRAKNFFWTDGSSKIDYKHFSDVLILDKTFKMDNQMICAPFFGLNHHQQYVLLGCALLLDETTHSLVWLLQTFMKAMDSVQPKTIITDESSTVTDAIKGVFPDAKHIIGLWYVRRNAASFSSKYYGVQSSFCHFFKPQSIFDWFFEPQTFIEFEDKWFLMPE